MRIWLRKSVLLQPRTSLGKSDVSWLIGHAALRLVGARRRVPRGRRGGGPLRVAGERAAPRAAAAGLRRLLN